MEISPGPSRYERKVLSTGLNILPTPGTASVDHNLDFIEALSQDWAFSLPIEVVDGRLCPRCQSMLSHWSTRVKLDRTQNVTRIQEVKSFGGLHHADYTSLEEAVAMGCHICSILESRDNYETPTFYRWKKGYGSKGMEAGIFFEGTDWNRDSTSDISDGHSMNLVLTGDSVRIECAHRPNVITEQARKSRAQAYTGDEAVLELVSRWFWKSRLSASTLMESFLPPRVLDIQEDPIRLIEHNEANKDEPYATLSYCWGRTPFLCHTPSTRKKLREGILQGDLPPTFQQAIAVARKLLIRYIWIDSLCILQGDSEESKQDWLVQAPLMWKIYRNSVLNIGADQASTPWEDLFQLRNVSDLEIESACTFRPIWKEQVVPSDCEWFRVTLHGYSTPFWPGPSGPITKPYFQGRIFERAWVVQEHLLAKRMLHFTSRQVLWEEEGQILSEAHPDRRYQTTTWPEFDDYGRSLHDYEAVRRWYQIVQRYSACDLTFATKDKFMAIAALAKEVWFQYRRDVTRRTVREITEEKYPKEKYGDLSKQIVVAFSEPERRFGGDPHKHYAAGIFTFNLSDMLRWSVVGYGKPHQRQKEWRAPTWSWASVDGPVSFPPEDLRSGASGHKDDDIITLDQVDIQYQSPDNSFGPLLSGCGSLYLYGRLLPCAKVDQQVYLQCNESKIEVTPYGPNQGSAQWRDLCPQDRLMYIPDVGIGGEMPPKENRKPPDSQCLPLLAKFDDDDEYNAASADLLFLPLVSIGYMTPPTENQWVDGLILEQVSSPHLADLTSDANDRQGGNDQSARPLSDVPVFRRLGTLRPLSLNGLGSVVSDKVKRSPKRLVRIV